MQLAAHRLGSWLHCTSESQFKISGPPKRRTLFGYIRMGHGEPIVLVPGLAGGAQLVLPLARRLALHNEIYVVEPHGLDSGRGQSGQATMESLAADLAQTIAHAGLERPTVFGVSFGGLVALQMACDQPSACGRLILYGADRRFEQTRVAELVRHVVERFSLPHDHPFLNQFFNVLFGYKPDPGALQEFVIARLWETDQSVVASRLRALEAFDLGDRIRELDLPALVIAGLRDVLARPARQEALAQRLPHAQYRTIEGAGHIGFLTHRREVARMVRSFLRVRHVVS